MDAPPVRSSLSLLFVILVFLGAFRGSALGRENVGPVLSLPIAEKRALQNNPSLRELQARIASSQARSIRAGELPDPRLTVGLINLPVDTFHIDQEPMTQSIIGLSQPLPFPGKLELKSEREATQAEAWRWERRNLQAELVRRIRNTWLQRFFLERSLDVIDHNLELFEELVTVARKQYVVGRGLQQDVLLAQTELDRIVNEKVRVQDEIYQANSRLTEMMAASYEDFKLPDTIPEIGDPPGAEELENGISEHPAVRSQDAMIRKMRTTIRLAEKAFYPDFTVNLSYGHRRAQEMDGDRLADFASARFTVDLPLFTKNRQEQDLAAARLEEEAAVHKRHSMLLELKHRARSGWSLLSRTGERIELFEEVILPESRQTIEASMAAYVSGKLDFLEIVRARLKHLQNELTLWRLKVDAQKARADLLYLADKGDRR